MKSSLLFRAFTIAAFFLSVAPFSNAAPGPGATNDFGGKRVLLIGIDGLRPDALRRAMANGTAPNMKSLVDSGTVTWNAFAGGVLGGAQQQVTLSGPGWASICTGAWIDRHGVSGNGTGTPYDTAGNYMVTQAPHFAKRLHEKFATARVDMIVSWNWLNTYLAAAQPGEFAYRYNGVGAAYSDRDSDVKVKTVAHLAANDPDVLQLHFDQIDGAGHATGFSPLNPTYLSAIAAVDGHIGDVIAAINARPQRASEQWNILITTDHGGTGTSHGGQTSAERTIFVIANGPAFPAGRLTKDVIGHNCIPPTIFKVLGVPVESAWLWSSGSFGVAPLISAYGAGTQSLIEIAQPAGGSLPGCTGIEVRRDGLLIATIPANSTKYVDQPTVPATGTQTYSYELTFVGTTEIRTGSTTLGTGAATVPNLSADMVLNMAFEGNAADSSGRGNHGTLTGSTANYTVGKGGGQAVLVNSTQYVTLGAPADLQFGASTDFTIGFWVKTAGGWTNDPAFISNKNWASGANTGWIVAGQQAGPNWQWNLKGAVATRKDFDPTGVPLTDNQWHHICVVHSRTGNATFYHDGQSIGTVAINGAGTTDTALPINIGRDGAGGSAVGVDVAIDDMKVWRRALSAADVAVLAPPPTVAPNITNDLVLYLPFDGNTLDSSGRGNHATLSGGNSFGTGRTGQALVLDATQYATLGQPTDLKFGASTPFTISMWVKNTGGWSSDPALISNKDWSSGTNAGWFIGGQGDATTWQWNFKGALQTRKDFDVGGVISDGVWHHIAVSHSRSGNATFFHDGIAIGTVSITGAGDVDTAQPINIGRDGAGNAAGINALVDDVRVWRRALTAEDLALIAPPVPAAWADWLSANFTAAERENPAVSGANADPDQDGIPNIHEYVFGTSPTLSNPSPISLTAQGVRFPEFHDGLGASGFGYTVGNVRSRLQYSMTLTGPWRNLPSDFQSSTILESRDSATHFTTLQLAPANAILPSGFFRLQLELVP